MPTTALASAQPQPSAQVNNPSFASDLSSSAQPQTPGDFPVELPVAAVQSVAAFGSENHLPANSNTTVADLPPHPEVSRNAAALTSQVLPLEAPQLSRLNPASVATTPAIVLQIDNVRPNQGKVKVAVFTEPETFLGKDHAAQTLELADATQMVTAEIDIKQPCAIAVFQDIDGDGELTCNRRGIPVEPCGFSNNAVIKRGPPKFADAAVNPGNNSATKVLIRLP